MVVAQNERIPSDSELLTPFLIGKFISRAIIKTYISFESFTYYCTKKSPVTYCFFACAYSLSLQIKIISKVLT